MKKHANLIQFFESVVLSGLLCFFIFFMKRGSDLFLEISLGFAVYAFLFLLLMIYIDGDKTDRGRCKLLPIVRSDLAFIGLLVEYAVVLLLTVLHNLGDVGISTAIIIYAIVPIIELLLIFIPAPKDAPAPVATNEKSTLKAKSLDYYSSILRKLIDKCEYQSLAEVMEKTAALLDRIDPEFSVQLDALENDISHKCVKIENALLTHNETQLVLLERELSSTVELIEKRCASHKYCLTDEGFYHVDDEIAMSQIDLLLDKLGLEYEEDLPTLNTPFESEFFYQKALKFASDEYAALLASYNAQIVEKLEKKASDKALGSLTLQSRMQKIGQALAGAVLICVVGITLYWHTTLQPNGMMLSENDDGTLTLVGYNPFYGDELILPDSVDGKPITVIGEEALMGSSLRKLVLSESVTTIEYQAIRDCYKLETLVLPKSLTYIGNFVFYADPALTQVCYRGSEEEWANVEIKANGNPDFVANTKPKKNEITITFDYVD